MEPLTIRVEGPAIGKARARVTRFGTFTPIKTRKWEQQIREAALTAICNYADRKFVPLTGPLRLGVTLMYEQPKSNKMTYKTTRPDLDNCIKSVDSLNGIVWADDAQIVEIHACKIWGPVDSMIITVTPIDEKDKAWLTKPKK